MTFRIELLFLLGALLSVLTEAARNNLNILVIGSSGSGKSSLLKNLVAGEIPIAAKFQAVAGSVKLKHYEVEAGTLPGWKGRPGTILNFFDTVGYAHEERAAEIRSEILEKIDKFDEIHYVFILIKAERNNPKAKEGMRHIITSLRTRGLKESNMKIFITHADPYTQNVRTQFLRDVQNYYQDVIAVEPKIACFASIVDIEDSFKSAYEGAKNKSISEIVDLLSSTDINPFSPQAYDYCVHVDCASLWFQSQAECVKGCMSKRLAAQRPDHTLGDGEM